MKLVSDVFNENLNKANIMHYTYMGTAGFHQQTDYKRSVIKKKHLRITCWTKYLWLTIGQNWLPGGRLNIKTSYQQCREPMLKIRRSPDNFIFNMGIHIPVKDGHYNATGPWPTLQWSLWSQLKHYRQKILGIFWDVPVRTSGISSWESERCLSQAMVRNSGNGQKKLSWGICWEFWWNT